MADPRKDDMAAALEAMMRGQADADSSEGPAAPPPVHASDDDATPIVPATPATAQPSAPRRQAAPQAPGSGPSASPRPLKPGTTGSKAPASSAAPPPPVDPAVPAAPPVAVPAASRPQPNSSGRPLTPTADTVRGALRPPAIPRPSQKSLEFRRTVIPILLTAGVLLISLGTIPFLASADSPFAAMRVRTSINLVFVASGVILLITAIVNMLAVKQQLTAAGKLRP